MRLVYLTIKLIELDYFTCLCMFLDAASSMTALWPGRVSQNTFQSTIYGLISQRVRSSSTQGLVVLGKHIKRASNSAKFSPVASATYNTFTNGFLQHHHRPHLYPHQRGDPWRLRRPGILRRITRPSVHPHRPGDSRRIWWPSLLCHRLSTLCSRLTWPIPFFVLSCMYDVL